MANPYSTAEEQLRQVMAWYPNKKLYKRSSSKSGKSIISVYPENSRCPVYSHNEWYTNDWSSPFLELDLNRPFFEQFSELQGKAPVVTLLSNLQENAEYCQDVEGVKNGYLVFDAINCRDVYYSVRIYNSNTCVDTYWVMESELLYDCTYMFSCYNCQYSFNCRQASDSHFLFDCRNVSHCFMSSGLRNKQYYIYNQPHTKEEYEAFMKSINLKDYDTVQKLKEKFYELLAVAPLPHAFLENCENVEGNYVKNSKNCSRAFESFDLLDCKNVFQCAKGRDIEGSFMCNDKVERCYQCVATGISAFDVKNCAFTWHSSNMEYCYLCIGCQDCFGCIGLRNKKYYIFNKPYSKEDYEKTLSALKAAMSVRGEYGLFFPMDLSPFLYEDTIAYDLFEPAPKSVEMALQYTPQELAFYEKVGAPAPRISFPQRYRQRMDLMGTNLTGEEIYKTPGKKIVSQEEYENSLR